MTAAPLPPLPHDDLARAFDLVGAGGWSKLARARIFLTGGTGFVGKWMLSALLEANRRLDLRCEVVVLSRDPQKFVAAAPHLATVPGVRLVEGDVRGFEFPEGRFSHVVHAATDVEAQAAPLETFDTCIEGTRRVLQFARRSSAADLLLLSSGAVYGRQPPAMARLAESYRGAPDSLVLGSAYGEGKRVAEWLCTAAAADSGLRVRMARLFAVVGPYLPLDKHFAIGNFLRDALAGQTLHVRGDGTPLRAYLHAADMAAWLWATLLRGRPGSAYNIGGDEAISIAELATRITAVLGSAASIEIAEVAAAGAIPDRYVPDVAKARLELGLPPSIPLDEAIARTARWHLHDRH